MDVSIIIPNYQGEGILSETLDALKNALVQSALATEVILCDDASTDGSVESVRENYPWVRVVCRQENGGFGLACNTGVESATAPLLFFVNSDVQVQKGFLEPLVRHLEKEDVFSAASVALDANSNVLEPTIVVPVIKRGLLRLEGLKHVLPERRLEDLQRIGAFPTLYGSGGAVLVRRDRFEELGGFSDIFAPFYYEDVDLGWRAWRRGWSSVFEPASVVFHQQGSTIKRTQDVREVAVLRKRNRFFVLWRNDSCLEDRPWRYSAQVLAHVAGRLLVLDFTSLFGLLRALKKRRSISQHQSSERLSEVFSNPQIAETLSAAQNTVRDFR